jgi:hypothetical protein
MKKKYEKPEMIVEVMALDMLQMACTVHGALPSRRNVTSKTCSCCASPNYAQGSHL